MENNQTITNKSRRGQGMFIFGIVLILLALVGWNSFSFGPGAFLGPILFAVPFVFLGGAGVILAIVGLIQFFFSGTRNGGSPQVAKPFSKKVFAAIVIFAVLVFSYLIWSLYPYIVKNPNSQVLPAASDGVAPATQLVADFNTYTNPEYGFSVRYPKNWKEPQVFNDPYVNVTFQNVAGTENFSIKGHKNMTLDSFTKTTYFHGPSDPYTTISIGGRPAARYDLIVPSYGRGGSDTPIAYSHSVQIGAETPNGSFIDLLYGQTFATKAEAQASDVSMADEYANWIQF